LADPFDVSPNTGIVIVPVRSGEKIVIDFLSSVHGINDKEVIEHRIKVRYRNAEFYILHPLHCLKSRISNVINLYRDDHISLTRIEIAIAIVKRRIIGLLDAERKRQALKETEFVFRLARNSRFGVRPFLLYGLDVFEAIPKDSRFGKRYPQMERVIRTGREKFKASIHLNPSRNKI
jgi:hypothetical protein